MKKLFKSLMVIGALIFGCSFTSTSDTYQVKKPTYVLRENESSEEFEIKVYTSVYEESTYTLTLINNNEAILNKNGEDIAVNYYQREGYISVIIENEIIDIKLNEDGTFEKYVLEPGNEFLSVDDVEEFYNNYLRDQWFAGMGLGSLLSLALTTVFSAIRNKYFKKATSEIKETNNTNTSTFNKFAAQCQDLVKAINEGSISTENAISSFTELCSKYNLTSNELITKTENLVKKIGDLSQLSEKMTAIIEILTLVTSTPENVKNGLYQKVCDIKKGVN